jgi:hypothetical protein
MGRAVSLFLVFVSRHVSQISSRPTSNITGKTWLLGKPPMWTISVFRRRFPAKRRAKNRPLPLPLALALMISVPGCSLAVMAGKVLLGDVKVQSQFRQATKTDLAKLNRKVLVLCSASDTIRAAYASVDYDVLDGVIHRLKVHGIHKIVSPDAVSGWLDDHGGRCDDLQEMAEYFHAEYVIHIEVSRFTCIEENSPNLLRGQSEGHVRAYHMDDGAPAKKLLEVMNSDFVSTYPAGNPISADKKSATNFQREYIERICLQLAQIFYDHAMSEEMQ